VTESGNPSASEILSSISQYIISCSDFELRKTIGRGGYGEVFYAIHSPTGRKVAFKRLLLDRLEGQNLLYFCREVLVLANCHNFFLLPFLGFSPEVPYAIVTEYIPRGSLFDALRHRNGSPELSPENRNIVTIGVARGMMALHRQQIVHRDLKSLNILLDADLYPKIADFGIARFMGDQQEGCTRNIGTPHWMAPEIFENGSYTTKVDVYAFGILIWELLTEGIPFQGKDGFQVAIAVARNGERPVIPDTSPPDVADFIRFCWDQDPAVRPPFPQIVRKLAQGLVLFAEGTGDSVFEFFRRMPISNEEERDMGTPDAEWSAEFEARFPETPNFQWTNILVAEGSWSPVDIVNEPLGHGSGTPRLSEVRDESSDGDGGGLFDGDESRDDQRDALIAADEFSLEYMQSMSPAEAQDVFQRMFEQHPREFPEMLSRLLITRRDLVGAALRSGVVASLELANEALLDAHVRILIVIVLVRPAAITAAMVHLLLEFGVKATGAQRLLKLFSVFVRNADENPQAKDIVELFLERSKNFIGLPHFAALLLAVHRNPLFEALRRSILSTLALGLLQSGETVTPTYFAAFCNLNFTFRDIPVAELIARAAEGRFALETIELLARLPQLPVSTRLITALVTVGSRSPLTVVCLCRLAMSLKGAQTVLTIPRWLKEGCMKITDVVVLLLVVCRFNDTRDALTEVAEFPDFVVRVMRDGESKDVQAVVTVLRKMAVTVEFVKLLDGKRFFEVFVPRAIESRVPVLQDGALLLMAHLAKVVWVDGYVYLMQYLPGLLVRGGVLGRKTLVVALLLARHAEAKGLLRYLNLTQAIVGCEVDSAWLQCKNNLLDCLRV
jgi:serine/threonine protein kinase